MTDNAQRREAVSAVLVIAAIAFGSAVYADKTPEPWAQTAFLELADGEVIGPVAFSPDGSKVVAAVRDAGGDYSARVWSTVTGLQLLALENPYPALTAYEFVSDAGDHIFAHTEMDMRAWSVVDGALSSDFAFDGDDATNDVAAFKDHFLATKQIGGAEFWSADGMMVTRDGLDPLRPYQDITITDSGMVYLKSAAFTLHMDLADFNPATDDLREAEASFGPYELFLASTASGDLVATYPEVATDGRWTVTEPTVRIRDDVPTATFETPVMTEITGFDGEIVTAEFATDDSVLLTRSDTGVASLWQVDGGDLVASTSNPGDAVTGAKLTISDRMLLSLTSGAAHLFDPTENRIVQQFPAPASDVAMSDDGTMIVTYGAGMSSARIWQKTSE